MKTLIILFFLFFSKSLFGEVLLTNIELNESISNYFSKFEFNQFNIENEHYGKNKKYSKLYIEKPSQLFDDNYTLAIITFENNSKKITYVSGLNENLNNCLKFRDEQILINSKLNLPEGNEINSKHKDGLEQKVISYYFEEYLMKYSCDFYSPPSPWAGTVDYRFDYLTWDYNEWVVDLMDTVSTPSQ